MNKISVTTIFAIILITLGAQAQSEQDVLRYSFTNVVGSARSMACGNAFGALGADYSSLVSNPAGLARYRNSELGITTNFFNTQANTFYIDNKRTDNSFNININNLGLAVALPTENTSGWRYVNIGFGVNRIANFNRSIYMEGVNNKSSIVQHFEQSANGTDTSDLSPMSGSKLAWSQYLIDNKSTSGSQYFSDFTYDSAYSLRQRNSIEQSGGMNDICIAMSGNYDDKVYIGGSINFYKVKFSEQNIFLENVLNNSVDYYQSLTYTNNIKTKGTGVGAKFGAIFLPTKTSRVGIAYHTPSRIYLEDSYNSSLGCTLGGKASEKITPDGTYNYSITTPGKLVISGAFMYHKRGFISVDFEHIDYRNGKLMTGNQNATSLDTFTLGVNNNVQTQYQAGNNLRVGAEYIIEDVYSIRAGAGFMGSPYKSTANSPNNFKTTTPFFSCGFGIRTGDYFFDVAISRHYATSFYAPYSLNAGGVAKYYTSETQNKTTNFTVSLGFKF